MSGLDERWDEKICPICKKKINVWYLRDAKNNSLGLYNLKDVHIKNFGVLNSDYINRHSINELCTSLKSITHPNVEHHVYDEKYIRMIRKKLMEVKL